MARRSGSEKRQRKHILPTRYNDEELAKVRASARARGCSTSAFVRATSLHYRLPLSRIDLVAAAQVRTALGSLTGAVNKFGSVFNQFARAVHRGREPQVDSFAAEWEEFKAMFDRDMAELRIVCLQALDKEPRRSASLNDEA